MVSTRGGGLGHTGRVDAIFWTTTNLKQACQMLSLNDFNILMVSFYNDGAFGHGSKRYWGQRCLEPLKKCRAERWALTMYHGFEAYRRYSSLSTHVLQQVMLRN